MLQSDAPAKFNVPWANGATSSYVRTPPVASQIGIQDGAASLTDGFPPDNFLAVGAGGIPPFGKDANGILKWITQWARYRQAGGTILYDATFQAAIGGYPLGARVESAATPGLIWRSTTNNNMTNPDTGGAGWSVIAFPDPNTAGLIITAMTASGANIRLVGNGNTTPNKTIRAAGGHFSVVNHAYTAEIMSIDDGGNTTVAGTFSSNGDTSGITVTARNGNVTALNGRLRASLGARGSGDASAATLLADFVRSFPAINFGYTVSPDGTIDQTIATAISAGGAGFTSQVVTLPVTYPNTILDAIASWDGTAPPLNVALSCQPNNNSSVLLTIQTTTAGGPLGVVIRSRGY